MLRDVAVVNVNKFGGGPVHRPAALRQAAVQFAPLLAEQLDALAPDVLALAGTAGLLPPEFWRAWASTTEEPTLPARVRGSRVLALPHPAQTTITHRAYWERARDAVAAIP